jgi:hypothetical protein
LLDRRAKIAVWTTLALGLTVVTGGIALIFVPLIWLLATDHIGAWKFVRVLIRVAALLTAVAVVKSYDESSGVVIGILYGALSAGAIGGFGELLISMLGPAKASIGQREKQFATMLSDPTNTQQSNRSIECPNCKVIRPASAAACDCGETLVRSR